MAGGPDPFSPHCILAGRHIGFKIDVPMVRFIRVLSKRLRAKVSNKNGLIFA